LAIAFFADDNGIAVAGDGALSFWDSIRGDDRALLSTHTGPITALAVSPDGKQLVTAGADRAIKLWDVTLRK
jgi:WD40 repeat protein